MVHKRRLIWTGVLCVLLLSTSPNCIAAIGTITEQLNSPGSIQRSTATLTASKGVGMEMMDTVKTTAGKVGITFADDTRVQINENSKLVIDDFVYDPKSKTGKLALNMASGTVRYASGAIAHNSPNKVAINTPTATIAVRGTDFTATVDELGASTIILLPSCPNGWADVKRDCKVGIIDVITDAGLVTLDQAFQATRVESRSLPPTKPVTINLSLDAMNNLLILSPPSELKKSQQEAKSTTVSLLSQDFLKEADLGNVLADQQKQIFQNKLSQDFLEQDFLANILTQLNAEMLAELKLLNTTNSGLLPDYRASTGIKAYVDDMGVTLVRDDGSNVQSVTVNKNETSTIYMQQGQYLFKNRINSGNGTTITLKQN